MRRLLPLLPALALAGCLSTPPSGVITCNNNCPISGFFCAPDGYCWQNGDYPSSASATGSASGGDGTSGSSAGTGGTASNGGSTGTVSGSSGSSGGHPSASSGTTSP